MATRQQLTIRHRKSEAAKQSERKANARAKADKAQQRAMHALGTSMQMQQRAAKASARGDHAAAMRMRDMARKAYTEAVNARDAARKLIYRRQIAEQEAAKKKREQAARRRELAAIKREERRLVRENKLHRRLSRLVSDINTVVNPHVVDEHKTGQSAPSIDTRTFADKMLGRAGRALTPEEQEKQKKMREAYFRKQQEARWKKDEEKEAKQRAKIRESLDKSDEALARSIQKTEAQRELVERLRAEGKIIDPRALKKSDPAAYAAYKQKRAELRKAASARREERRRNAERRRLMSNRPIRGAADAITKGQSDVSRAFGKGTTALRKYTVQREREKEQAKLDKRNARRARLRAAIKSVTGLELPKNNDELRSERNKSAATYKKAVSEQRDRQKKIKALREKLRSELVASGMSDPHVVEALKEMAADHDKVKSEHQTALDAAREKRKAHAASVAEMNAQYEQIKLTDQRIEELKAEIASGKHEGEKLASLKKMLAADESYKSTLVQKAGKATADQLQAKQEMKEAYEKAREVKARLKEAKDRLERAQADSPEAAAIRQEIRQTQEEYENAKATVKAHKADLLDKQKSYDDARKPKPPGWLGRQRAKLAEIKKKVKDRIADVRDKYHRIPLFGKKKEAPPEKKKKGIAYMPMSGGTAYGSALLLGMAGHRMPSAANTVDKAKKEAEDATEPKGADKAPGPLHKGPKGGLFYYNSAGHKVYVGGQSGFKGMLTMFSAGKTGKRLFK
jgi:hypothetical protein